MVKKAISAAKQQKPLCKDKKFRDVSQSNLCNMFIVCVHLMQSFRNGIREAITAAPREKLGGSERKQSASSLIIQYPIHIFFPTKPACHTLVPKSGVKISLWVMRQQMQGPEIMLIKQFYVICFKG